MGFGAYFWYTYSIMKGISKALCFAATLLAGVAVYAGLASHTAGLRVTAIETSLGEVAGGKLRLPNGSVVDLTSLHLPDGSPVLRGPAYAQEFIEGRLASTLSEAELAANQAAIDEARFLATGSRDRVVWGNADLLKLDNVMITGNPKRPVVFIDAQLSSVP